MIYAPNMLMIGSAGRNAGKTVLACSIVERFRGAHSIIAVKVTAVSERDGLCPRGGEGCGACSTLDGPCCITEETTPGAEKDTQRLLAAGAQRVYWLRVLKDNLEEGAKALLELFPPDVLAICESNSLRRVVEPQLFFMCAEEDSPTIKDSAREVYDLADVRMLRAGTSFLPGIDGLDVCEDRWALKYPASAVILAGGESSRMGRDKALLPIQGCPLIERLCRQLRPHFGDLFISTNSPAQFSFLENVTFVADKSRRKGPVMGIVSALTAARFGPVFVISCDVPKVDIRVVRTLMRQLGTHDAVVPVSEDSQVQPLFAVYRKTCVDKLTQSLRSGNYSVKDALAGLDTKYVPCATSSFVNLNTIEDYNRYMIEVEHDSI